MRKQTYQIRSNLTVTLNGVVLPKLPSVNDINIGEIALNYKDGYETISIKNDNNEIVTFATLELLINYMEEYYGNAKIFKGTCATAAATTAKVVTCPLFKSTDLVKGTLIFVTFDLTNSGAVGSLTMNVNSTGAKSIKKLINNTAIASSNLSHAGELKANQTYLFEYDGTYWVCTTLDYNSTYSAMTQAEIDAGTSTSSRLITPKLLRDNLYTETEVNNLLAQKQNVDLIVTVSDIEDGNGTTSGTTDYSVSEILTLQQAGRNVYIKFGAVQLPLVYSTLSKLIYAMTVASDSATGLLPPVILSSILEGTTATFYLLTFDPIAFNGIDLAPVATSGDYNDLDNIPTIPAAPGTLNTNNTTAQTVSSSEALSGAIKLHKVSKTGSYSDLIKPSTGIPKTDLASAVQTSLGKADSAIQGVKVNGTALTPDSNKAVNIDISGKQDTLTPNTPISIVQGTGSSTGTTYIKLVGSEGTDISHIVESTNNGGWEHAGNSGIPTVALVASKVDAKYTKPSTGIPKTDLASAVQTSLGKADTAIQGVKVNGAALTPDANKVVDVTVPTNVSDLTNDLNFVRRYHLLGLSVLLLTDSGEWAENSELNTPTIVFKFNQTEDNILLGEFYPTFMYCKLPKAANIDFYPNTILGLTSYITINLGEPLGYYNGNNAKPYWRTGWDVVPTVSLAFDNGSGSINTVPGINMTFVGVLDRGAIGQGTHYITICYNSIYRNYNFDLLIFYDLELQRLHLTKPFVLTISSLGIPIIDLTQ